MSIDPRDKHNSYIKLAYLYFFIGTFYWSLVIFIGMKKEVKCSCFRRLVIEPLSEGVISKNEDVVLE